MVNYLYDLDQIEKNHRLPEEKGIRSNEPKLEFSEKLLQKVAKFLLNLKELSPLGSEDSPCDFFSILNFLTIFGAIIHSMNDAYLNSFRRSVFSIF